MSFTSRIWTATTVAVATAAIALSLALYNPGHSPTTAYSAIAQEAATARAQLEKKPEVAKAADISEAFQAVAKAMRPSVVSISSVRTMRPTATSGRRPNLRQQLPEGLQLPPGFERFFDEDSFEQFGGSQPRSFQQRGMGSGFVVSEDGTILTNNHVIRGADEVTVTFVDGRQMKAKVVGADEKTDVAVIKVDAKDLVPAKLGDSDAIEVGQWALAIGSPFGLDQTVTSGIVSAKGRNGVGILDYEDFLQTDAAINPGNSGGPLVNIKGEVIGINTAIASRSGGYQGVGFAIPSNLVQGIMRSLIDTGKVERGWLGAAVQNLTQDLSASFGFKSRDGVLIGDVVAGSPAAKAGLKGGDIVTHIAGKAVTSANQLRNTIAATKPGTAMELTLFRDGGTSKLTVSIGKLEGSTPVATEAAPAETTSEIGLTVATLTPETARELGLDESTRGVAIESVESGSAAEAAGLQAGDVIVSVDGQNVADAKAFAAAVTKEKLAKGVRLSVQHDKVRRFVFLRAN